MAIVMNRKIDIYLANPEHFLSDLERQRREWIRNVVHPLGSHYEASRLQIDMVKQIAQAERAAQDQRLARIELVNQIVIGVLFMGIDICAAGALRGVSPLTKRFSSQRNFETFRSSAESFEAAWRSFSSQTPTMLDSIIADVEGKLRSAVSTGSVRSAVTTISSLVSDINAAMPTADAANFAGPVSFQNSIDDFYSTTCDAIYDTFVNLVRDSSASADTKRRIATYLVHLPFCKPPDLSLSSFAAQFKNFFELSYWCQLISGTSHTTRNFGLIDDYLADTINKRILFLTDCYLTHVGGRRADGSRVIRQYAPIGLANIQEGDVRMAWDGYCSNSQSQFCKQILFEGATNLVQPFFVSLGISAQMTHG